MNFQKSIDNLHEIVYNINIKGNTTQTKKEHNTMSKSELLAKIELLNEYEAMLEELRTETEAIRDEIKTEMTAQNTEEMTVGKYIIRWTSILSNRFDSTAFKKVMPEVYKAYTKQISSRRFTISV